MPGDTGNKRLGSTLNPGDEDSVPRVELDEGDRCCLPQDLNDEGPSSSDSPTNRSLPGPSGTIQPPNLIRPSAIQNPLLRGAAMPGGAAGPTGLPPRAVPTQVSSSHEVDPFQAQLHKLRQEQAAQEQLLYSQFQAKISKLQEKHEWEMQQHLQQLLREQQQRAAAVAAAMRLEEERRASPPSVAAQPSGVSLNEKLEALKNKDERSQSAVASSEVKLKLQEFVLSKRQRESSAPHSQGPSSGRPGPIRTGSPGSPRQW
ncbi:unnamed protein product [Cyprideis torosa]|uniref:histone deacetylase n=1 Tax=Cyprideis torosa TaxID=163714 RepID=A0A7R8W730_9CRUS|nr:unnamed protein product [Cyprideis torosa]CAG0884698.1 unnamed protein product [Cyprideis torosa]